MLNIEHYKDYIVNVIASQNMNSFRDNPIYSFEDIVENLINEDLPDYPLGDRWAYMLNWLCKEYKENENDKR